jgi:hypothetical protein
MLALVRLLLTLALGYSLIQAARVPTGASASPDLSSVFWIAISVLLAILSALAWVPWLGEQFSDPATGPLNQGAFVERTNRLLGLIRSLERRGWRRLTRWLAVIEGIRHPWLPGAFVAGMNTATPGSWLERIYAREVLRFNNADNCIRAYRILRNRGETPPTHHNDKINHILISLDHAAAPEAPPLPVPESAPPPLNRNPGIRLAREPNPGAPTDSNPGTQPSEPGTSNP